MIIGPPGYATEAAPSTIIPLPVSWDPDSNPFPVDRQQILIETGRGITFEYELFSRDSPNYIFTVPASLLVDFRTMHFAVVGSAFFFFPDSLGSPSDGIHVRKEPGFSPEPLGVFLFDGVAEQFFKYELKLRQEITAADVDD